MRLSTHQRSPKSAFTRKQYSRKQRKHFAPRDSGSRQPKRTFKMAYIFGYMEIWRDESDWARQTKQTKHRAVKNECYTLACIRSFATATEPRLNFVLFSLHFTLPTQQWSEENVLRLVGTRWHTTLRNTHHFWSLPDCVTCISSMLKYITTESTNAHRTYHIRRAYRRRRQRCSHLHASQIPNEKRKHFSTRKTRRTHYMA